MSVYLKETYEKHIRETYGVIVEEHLDINDERGDVIVFKNVYTRAGNGAYSIFNISLDEVKDVSHHTDLDSDIARKLIAHIYDTIEEASYRYTQRLVLPDIYNGSNFK